MTDFKQAYEKLNKAQKQAVNTIDGPMLVIAGPGTGKTQLISARIAQILKTTDTLPQNILCLTFTENGALNMRERLTQFIGQAAYDVTISTYHAFGGDLIRRFPEYFTETRLQDPVDALGQFQILSSIVDELSYLNPLKQTRHHLRDLISTVSEVKRALLSSEDLRKIALQNQQFISSVSPEIGKIFSDVKSMPSTYAKSSPYFLKVLKTFNGFPAQEQQKNILAMSELAKNSLKTALQQAEEMDKSTPLTGWKNKWLAKDAENRFILQGELKNKRIAALASVLDSYQNALQSRGLYDFDDMIIRSIDSLAQNNDLRFTLQEQYLYVLLDEFQDTNTAQLRLVELLSNNPVSEGRPNIMAVGDDDQAIYAFQGAQYSNMLDFYNMYSDVAVVNLTENYRSHKHIIQASLAVSAQIQERVHHKFKDTQKSLLAANESLPSTATLSRKEFASDIAQYSWIADQIKKLQSNGVALKEIAILAPKHRYLEPLVPYLNNLNIPVRYEKRENILQTPIVKQLLSMSRLVLAIKDNDRSMSNSLWPEVLSFDFWKIPTELIWQISWEVSDSKDQSLTWNKAALNCPEINHVVLLFLALASRAEQETCEAMLDFLIGTEEVKTNADEASTIRSPLRDFYTNQTITTEKPQLFYETLSHLKVLRDKLREYQNTKADTLYLKDLMNFVAMYEEADQQMLNTSPYNQTTDAVQIMTVFKAKGLEYEHVFLPSCSDDVWGPSASGNSNKLTLPANLEPIRHAGANDDERLRILFVAMTRAKHGLYMTSFTHKYTGKTTARLKYFDEQQQDDGSFKAKILPDKYQLIHVEDMSAPTIKQFELDWQTRHSDGINISELKGLLQERLQNYKLSPTHLNSFTDMQYGGPQKFFLNTILRFPQAPSLSSQFGSTMHDTMQWLQEQIDDKGNMPTTKLTIAHFEDLVARHKMPPVQAKLEIERGSNALGIYLSQRGHIFKQGDRAEFNFWNENVVLNKLVRLNGKIDRMEIDEKSKQIIVVDYKTGRPYSSWKADSKLHKYKQQLYCYKLLIENSRTFAGYKVVSGRLEFLEPDENNKIQTLDLSFDERTMGQVTDLLGVMWKLIMKLDFPDTSDYSLDLKGTKQFEEFLLAK